MSKGERDDGEERREEDAPREEGVEEGEGADQDAAGELDLEDGPAEGPITLDRYLSRRRPPVKPAWMQIFSLVAMITALVLILIYKDRCAGSISGFMGTMNPQPGTGTGQHIPVRYQHDKTER